MTDLHERLCVLALQQIFPYDPVVGRKVLEAAGSARAVFERDRDRFRCFFERQKDLYDLFRRFDDWKSLERTLARMEKCRARAISISDDAYPLLLRQIYDPPVVLTVIGPGVDGLSAPAVAIVGSRKASRHGLGVASSIAEALSLKGFTIVSGMAYGIDTAAHMGALSSGGVTAAVLGSGADIAYPPQHGAVYGRICREGAIVSEFPLGAEPLKHHFPQRNRIISGICHATVIVEAAERSGSLITARFALEQGREVFAVPGLAMSPGSRGTNSLIRDGAALVESGAEVAEALALRVGNGPFSKKSGHLAVDVDKDSPILAALPKSGSVSIDELIAGAKMAPAEAISELGRLIVAGCVDELPGRRFRKSAVLARQK